MTRPRKTTVDYFPHDCQTGKTIFTLENLYGNDGYAFWFKLLEILGSTDGHYYDIGKTPDKLYLFSKAKVSEETGNQILRTLSDLNAICPKLYKKNIVWSDNFVTRLRGVYDKRFTNIPTKPDIRGENKVNRGKNPQSKVKESKEKKRYGEFNNVLLTDIELKKLKDKFNSGFQSKIEELSLYLESKGDKYKSHYATILNWERKKPEKSRWR